MHCKIETENFLFLMSCRLCKNVKLIVVLVVSHS